MDRLGATSLKRRKHNADDKQSLLVEDLRNHSPKQLAELCLLLGAGAPLRPDPRRSRFFEIDGDSHVFYICKYPSGKKVLLIAVWERERTLDDPEAGVIEKSEMGEELCVDQ